MMVSFKTIILILIFLRGSTLICSTDDGLISLNSLKEVLSGAAGCYTDKWKSAANKLEKSVIVTLVNNGYIGHLHNFRCYLDSKFDLIFIKFLCIAYLLGLMLYFFSTRVGFKVPCHRSK